MWMVCQTGLNIPILDRQQQILASMLVLSLQFKTAKHLQASLLFHELGQYLAPPYLCCQR